MANTLMQLLIEITADTSKAQKGLKDVEGATKKTAATNTQTAAGIGKLAAQYLTATAAITAATTAIKFCIDAASESERVDARLNAVLQSTAGAAGMTKNELEGLATNLSHLSTYDDEAIKGSEALLLTFTKIGKDVFPEAQQAILDMSAALGQDLQSSTIQLGKALNDPIKGVTALQRVGVSFTQGQRDMIKSLVESGRTLDAQKIILRELSTEFGGQAAAAANTYEGQIKQLNNELGNLGEAIGKDAIPELTDMVRELKDVVVWVEENYESIKKLGSALEWLVLPLKVRDLMHDWGNKIRDSKAAADETVPSNTALGNSIGGISEDIPSATDGLEDLDAAMKATEDAAKNLSKILEGELSAMFTIQNQTDNYNKTLADLATKDGELAAEKNRLTLKMWEEQSAGKLTNDEYLDYIKNLDDVTKAQAANAKAREDANTENAKAGTQRVYDLVQQKLAADGIINSGEFEYLQNLAVQKGLVSKAAADQAIAENKAADELVANFAKTQPAMDQTLTTMQQIAAFDGVYVDFGVRFTQQGNLPTPTVFNNGFVTSGIGGSQYALKPSGTRAQKRDSGGVGIAGTPYMIGTGAQPEMFIPASHGSFIPNADKKGFGATYNIQIFNPKKEAAENSIRSALKSLSYTGAAA